MAIQASDVYDWILANWSSKCNYIESDSPPVNAPSTGKLTFHYNTTSKKVSTYDFSTSSWKEGLGGGGGGTSDIVSITANTNITLEASKGYDLVSGFQNAIFTIPKPTSIGQTIRVLNSNGSVDDGNYIKLKGDTNVTLNGTADNYLFNLPRGVVDLVSSSLTNWMILPMYTMPTLPVRNAISISSNAFTVSNGITYLVDTSANATTVTVPTLASDAYPFSFVIVDTKKNANAKNITIDFTTNSNKFEGNADNFIINTNGGVYQFVATNSTYGFTALQENTIDISSLKSADVVTISNQNQSTLNTLVNASAKNVNSILMKGSDGNVTLSDCAWQSYTPTITATTTNPTLATTNILKGLYKVTGKTLTVKFVYQHSSKTGATNGNGTYLISLPPAYNTINTTLMGSGTSPITPTIDNIPSMPCGYGAVHHRASGESNEMTGCNVYHTTDNKLFLMLHDRNYVGGNLVNTTGLYEDFVNISFTCELPIL